MSCHMPEPHLSDHTQNINSKKPNSKCIYKSPLFGGYLLTCAPCYSSCGSYIFVTNSSRVHVYNSRDLSYRFVIPLTNSIIKTAVYSSNNDYLLVLSKPSSLIVYRIDESYTKFDKFVQHSFTGLEILDMNISKFGTIFLVTREKSNVIGICRLQLNIIGSNSEIIESKDDLEYLCKFDQDICCFTISITGELIAVSISKLLFVFKLDKAGFINLNKPQKINNLEMYCALSIHQITTLAFHPRENYLACGDITGKVITWNIKQITNNDTLSDKSQTLISYLSLDSILNGRMNNDFSFKKMGSYYIVNPNKIISPQDIAKFLVSSEESLKSGLNNGDLKLKSDIHFGKFMGLLEYDTRVLHWHAHAVNSLVFTTCGRFMLTGGEEAVVVIWDLENDTKRFITRLESTIFNIVISTVDNIPRQYLVTCGNNCLRTFDPILLLLKHTIFGIQIPISMSIANFENCKSDEINDQFTKTPIDNIVSVKPMRRNIYFQSLSLNQNNSIPYGLIALSISGIRLQFFSLITGLQHSFLDFIDSNYVSRSQEDLGFTFIVEEICISNDCNRIVASSFRNIYQAQKHGNCNEKRILRFWHKNPDEFVYNVNTQINNVHINRVLNIFELACDRFASISTSDWKIWSFNLDFSKWNCMFTGSFKGFPNYVSCVSPDQSLLVLSHGRHLSFWSSDDQLLLLHKKLSNDIINHICFVDDQHLLTATDYTISIWDIFSESKDPIFTHSYNDFKITQLVFKEFLSNVFILISTNKTTSKIDVFQINDNYSFKSVHVEEQSIPNGFITCCMSKVPSFALNSPNDYANGININGVSVDYIINSGDYVILLVVLLNNLEFKTYVISSDITVTNCEYLLPVVTDDKIEKRHTYDSDSDVGLNHVIKRPSIIRPFEDDCPTFALPSPSVVFHRMARSLLKSQNTFSPRNGLSNGI